MVGKKENYFFDPNKLPRGEREYYDKISPIIEGLLNDLESQDWLRKASVEEIIQFIGIMKDKSEIALAHNRLTEIFDNPERLSFFLKNNREYFTDQQFSYLFMSQLYFLFLVYVEMFRSFLLFYLKRGPGFIFKDRMTLGPFLAALKKCSPKYGEQIEKEMALNLRNAFAHGLFQIVMHEREPALMCYRNLGELNRPTSFPLSKLLIIWKNHNILYMTLAHLMAKKMRARRA
jgi:hypothetical protein